MNRTSRTRAALLIAAAALGAGACTAGAHGLVEADATGAAEVLDLCLEVAEIPGESVYDKWLRTVELCREEGSDYRNGQITETGSDGVPYAFERVVRDSMASKEFGRALHVLEALETGLDSGVEGDPSSFVPRIFITLEQAAQARRSGINDLSPFNNSVGAILEKAKGEAGGRLSEEYSGRIGLQSDLYWMDLEVVLARDVLPFAQWLSEHPDEYQAWEWRREELVDPEGLLPPHRSRCRRSGCRDRHLD